MQRIEQLTTWIRGRTLPRSRIFTTPAWLHGSRLTRAVKWLDRGGRGNFLVVFGIIYLVLGQSYLTANYPPALDALSGVAFMPVAYWGGVWIAAGIVAIVSGVVYSPAKDRWGFLALSCLSFWWGMSYLFGWLLDDVEGGWRSAIVYGGYAVAALIMAGMIDPATVDRMKADDQERYDDAYPPVQS